MPDKRPKPATHKRIDVSLALRIPPKLETQGYENQGYENQGYENTAL
jgi:hypothetical protein